VFAGGLSIVSSAVFSLIDILNLLVMFFPIG